MASAQQDFDSHPAARPLRTVAIVGRHPDLELLDTVLTAGNYDVAIIESTDLAYSCIKAAAPHLVIVCADVDDAAAFHVLTMLKLDDATANIPLVTCFSDSSADPAARDSFEIGQIDRQERITISMN